MALRYNTTGKFNTASGMDALYTNTSGTRNTASGYQALKANTTGTRNTASGVMALKENTTGSYNTASGVMALNKNTTGLQNTASGVMALRYNTTGSQNTASGMYALYTNTTGDNNTASGATALYTNTTGVNNTAGGFQALKANTTGSYNTASGMDALYTNTTGSNNTASGQGALKENTTGDSNTASGVEALYSNTTGIRNTASGYLALRSNTTGGNNTAIGYGADVGSGNLSNATAIGNGATVIESNTMVLGNDALNTVLAGELEELYIDYVLGEAGTPELSPSTTNLEIVLMDNSSNVKATGTLLKSIAAAVAANDHDPAIPATTDIHIRSTSDSTNQDVWRGDIGDNWKIGWRIGSSGTITEISVKDIDEPVLRRAGSGDIGCKDIFVSGSIYVNGIELELGDGSGPSSGSDLFGSGSDKRIKKNIEETDLGLDFITQLRPVRYNWVNPADYPPELLDERFKNKDNKATRPKDDPRFYDGLIAQEVEETLNTLNKKWSGHNIEKNAGKKQSLVYSSLVMPLIKSVQQLNNRLITQESEISELKKIIQELKK
jgi:hypothetical protein